MALNLDLRQPTIVIAGAFNPAIFERNWIAKHLLEIPTGSVVQAAEVIVGDSFGNVRSLIYVNGIAIAASMERLEFFVSKYDNDSAGVLENAAKRLVEVLPHTPIGALGVNFHFVDDEAPASVTDLFDTPEQLEGEYPILLRQLGSQLKLDGKRVLNLKRSLQGDSFVVDFNFHYPKTETEDFLPYLDGCVTRSVADASSILAKHYKYEAFGQVSHLDESSGTGGDEQ